MLKNKIALVTGSTSGIGLGVARALAAQGAHILFNGFGDVQEIAKIRLETEQQNVRTDYYKHDLTKADQIEAMMEIIHTNWGRVDILVNNAGIQHVAPMTDFSVEKWDQVLALNLSAAFHTSRLALPAMQKNNWGRIINIASVHGLVASTQKSAYVAAKHGLIGLTKVVALENARSGITCNAICPGWVLTPLVQKQIETRAQTDGVSLAVAQDKLLGEKQPSAQFVQPSQIGAMSVFLCSDAASEIRGASYVMDGGWSAQ